MLENFNEDKRKNSMTQFSDFHTGWSIHSTIFGSGHPLIIVHGLFGSSDNWATLGKRFSSQFEVHLVDVRNHGRSFHSYEMNYSVIVDDVLYYMQEKNIEHSYFIGHSMGGKIVMELAMKYPDTIDKLVVADIAPKSYPNHHQYIFNALKSIDFSIYTSRKSIDEKLSKSIKNSSVRQFLTKNLYWKIPGQQLGWRFNLDALNKHYLDLMKGLNGDRNFTKETLFLKGKHSEYILDSDQELLAKHFPNYELKTIPKSGHWLHAENPNAFFDFVNVFLSS